VTVVCDGKPMNGSPFVAKAFNTSAIQLSGMPSIGVVFCPVEFTGKQSAQLHSKPLDHDDTRQDYRHKYTMFV